MAQVSSDSIELTAPEQRVLNATLECMDAIRALYGGKNPCNFENEAIPAIHVLQQFARQHWAYRVNPEAWGDWTHPDE
jgi:hypothetical protein